ncbi:MAG: membrane dipeptidase [Tepidisphaeraceae bacterium]|jgi:membrane dipeptidase
MFIADAHLDLADNVMAGRPVDRPAREQKPDEWGIPTVGLPDLRDGSVRLIGATLFCMPSIDGRPGYHNAEEAHAMAMRQLAWYRAQESAGNLKIVRAKNELRDEPGIQAVLILEGADPLRDDRDMEMLFEAGVRAVGLAWKRTRFAGGTGAPGPLTAEGVAMMKTLDRLGVIHDTSHLAEETFWELLRRSDGPVIASHSNCRAIVPTDRQLSDEMIRAIAQRGGVIGINFYDKFLLPPTEFGKRRATLDDVTRHIRHMCDVIGDAQRVGLGTDMDGGFGQENIPVEIQTAADLPRVAEALERAGFGPAEVEGLMGLNWRRFFRENL